MNKLSMIFGMVLAVLLLSACTITVQQPTERQDVITVTGSSQFKAVPDQATVYLQVETNGTTAKEAQDKNSRIMDAVQNALLRAGLDSRDMETTYYNVYPYTYWDYEKQRQVEAGYKASHSLKITTNDIKKVGTYIQVGIDAGATSVNSISFELSKVAEKDAKNEALKRAVQDAKSKAEALADGIGKRLGKVVSVSINEYYAYPIMRAGAEVMAAKDSAVPPPIMPQELDVSASVQVVFEIE
ncbi:MAG: SIMPL domain-containing protein [Candidatus Woesearchaeota archaeon]